MVKKPSSQPTRQTKRQESLMRTSCPAHHTIEKYTRKRQTTGSEESQHADVSTPDHNLKSEHSDNKIGQPEDNRPTQPRPSIEWIQPPNLELRKLEEGSTIEEVESWLQHVGYWLMRYGETVTHKTATEWAWQNAVNLEIKDQEEVASEMETLVLGNILSVLPYETSQQFDDVPETLKWLYLGVLRTVLPLSRKAQSRAIDKLANPTWVRYDHLLVDVRTWIRRYKVLSRANVIKGLLDWARMAEALEGIARKTNAIVAFAIQNWVILNQEFDSHERVLNLSNLLRRSIIQHYDESHVLCVD
eukprot:Selendium_serpulae@DN8151_c0_g1_i1.p1